MKESEVSPGLEQPSAQDSDQRIPQILIPLTREAFEALYGPAPISRQVWRAETRAAKAALPLGPEDR